VDRRNPGPDGTERGKEETKRWGPCSERAGCSHRELGEGLGIWVLAPKVRGGTRVSLCGGCLVGGGDMNLRSQD